MKKILLFTIALISYSNIFAQTEQGKIVIGASSNLAFSSAKVKDADDSTINFEATPQVGFFVVDSSVYLDSINYIVIGGVIIVVLTKLFVRLFKLKRY